MRRTVRLGSLPARRVFYLDARRRFQVVYNMAPAGVVVRRFEERTVTIKSTGRTFKSTRGHDEIWSAGAEVEIEVRERKGAGRAPA